MTTTGWSGSLFDTVDDPQQVTGPGPDIVPLLMPAALTGPERPVIAALGLEDALLK